MTPEARQHRERTYWRRNVRLVLILLSVWFTVSFVFGILLVDQLNQFRFFGFRLGFWISQQGSILVFLLLIFIYAWRMNRLDADFKADRGKEDAP